MKMLCKSYRRSSTLMPIKLCYTVKAVCHRGPCESGQSLVSPSSIYQRFLMDGTWWEFILKVTMHSRGQLQLSPYTVQFVRISGWKQSRNKMRSCRRRLACVQEDRYYSLTWIYLIFRWNSGYDTIIHLGNAKTNAESQKRKFLYFKAPIT